MINELYIIKSFCCMGESLDKCFNCEYCRAEPLKTCIKYDIVPSDINPIFTNLPITINMFYGDSTLQVENTKKYLKKLEDKKHKGIVVIITKGKITDLGDLNYDLNLNIALSTIGIKHESDIVSHENFLYNLDHIKDYPNIKFSCEFRPIMYGINDSIDIADRLMQLCQAYYLPIGYCGLQASDGLKEIWKRKNITYFKPFPEYSELCVKKPISEKYNEDIYNLANKYNVPIFKKTSCLLSYSNGLDRDYNAHIYRPNENSCNKCKMYDECLKFRENQNVDDYNKISGIIPFEFKIKEVYKHKCNYHDVCKFPHLDCTEISGHIIEIDEEITSADIRVIKWLTGYTVNAKFTESPFLSDKWRKNE